MEKVLFICVHNSARSQMAEEYLRQMAGGRLSVTSAGFDPKPINPLAVEVMGEEGIDISGKEPNKIFELYKDGNTYDYVITVCSESDEQCPVFPGLTHRLHLPFADPARLEGSHEEKLAKIREIRDKVKETTAELLRWIENKETNGLGDYWEIMPTK